MSGVWQENIVRLCSADGQALGTGTLVSTRQNGLCVLTCAHVLNAALGRDDYSQARPGDEAEFLFDLPARSRDRKYHAKLLEWSPPRLAIERVAQPVGDIALLKIVEDIPASVRPYSADDLVVDELEDRLVRSFGFSQPNGEFAAGRLLGGDVGGWVHFTADSIQESFIAPGFSGAPLLDEERRFILGMVVAVDDDADSRIAYALGTQLIWTACPQLARPYRGLRDFGERDRAFFFGRKIFVGKLREKLRTYPIVGVAGASGSGKSSVVKAGLIPELRKERNWTVLKMRPAADPWAELAKELMPLLHERLPLGEGLGKEEELTQKLRDDPLHLGTCLRGIAKAQRSDQILLFVDQFEELFTQAGHEPEQPAGRDAVKAKRPDFRDLMIRTAWLKGSPSIQWIYTLRADFAGQAYRHPAFVEALKDGEEKLADMNGTELRQSIAAPARNLMVTFEDGIDGGPSLSERIVDAVEARPGSLPLMAHLLEKLWELLERRQITHAAYDRLGGLEGALDRHADEVFDRLSEEQKLSARQLMSRLVKVEEGNEATRRVSTREQLGEDLWEVAGLLAEPGSRLLVIRGTDEGARQAEVREVDRQARRQTVEVAHEALLRNWGKFRDWLKQDLAFLLWRQRLGQRLTDYDEAIDKSGVRLFGTPLQTALGWLQTRRNDLSKNEQEFIETSALESDRAEAERREQEDKLKQQQVEIIKRQRQFIVVAIVLAALAVGFGVYAVTQRWSADDALRQALITQSQMSVRLSDEQLAAGNPNEALATALTGSQTTDLNDFDRPIVPDIAVAVSRAVAQQNVSESLRGHLDSVVKVYPGPEGTFVLTVGADATVSFWKQREGYPHRLIKTVRVLNDILAISATKHLVAFLSEDRTVGLWDPSENESKIDYLKSNNSPKRLVLSDNGELLAEAGSDGQVVVWNVPSKKVIWQAPSPVSDITFMAIDPAWPCLVAATAGGRILKWDLKSAVEPSVQAASGHLIDGSFVRHGQFIYTTDDGGVWSTPVLTWSATTKLGSHDRLATSIAVSHDQNLVATTSIDGTALIWNATNLSRWRRLRPHLTSWINASAFSPDGTKLALASDGSNISIWDLGSDDRYPSEVAILRGHLGTVLDLRFSPDGKWLASGSTDGTARLWKIHTNETPYLRQAHTGPALHVQSAGGDFILSAGLTDKELRVWASDGPFPIRSTQLHYVPSALALSADGTRAFVGTRAGELILFTKSIPSQVVFSKDNGVVTSLALSPDGSLLAATGLSGHLLLCQVQIAKPKCENLTELPGWGTSVTFSQDGRWLGASSNAADARTGIGLIWNLVQHTSGPLLIGHMERVSSIRFDTSGNKAVTISWDGTARIWGTATGKELARLVGHKGNIVSAAFSPDGEMLATASYDRTVRLWLVGGLNESSSTKMIDATNVLTVQGADLNKVEFDDSSTLVASSSTDGTVRIWFARSGELRSILTGDGSPLVSMSISPDGRQVVGSSQDGALLKWDLSAVLSLPDEQLVSFGRSVVPLAGAITAKDETPLLKDHLSSSEAHCRFEKPASLGLPPHWVLGSNRARELLIIPEACSRFAGALNSGSIAAARIAEAEGDYETAKRDYSSALKEGNDEGHVGLGDLAFLYGVDLGTASDVEREYTLARDAGVDKAASRLGWLMINDIPKAKEYFREAAKQQDADGYAGLAWIHEQANASLGDLSEAFSNYVIAQHLYEINGETSLANMIADRRAMIARLLEPNLAAKLLVSSRAQAND
ncbi:trypsin-like peptidase domain-containing protein [Mesorhizobium sp. M0016]|uniref:nSTAND1 domain-containing NTPase n=1 Tax=Mesorhizobium sp. M0016 TaxID=2956843 RepID=UPI00333644C5